MPAIGAKRQIVHRDDGRARQCGTQMRETLTAPGCLPSEFRPESLGIDLDQQQIGLAGAMAPRALRHLGCRGKMQKTVRPVFRRSRIAVRPPGLVPVTPAREVIDPALRHVTAGHGDNHTPAMAFAGPDDIRG